MKENLTTHSIALSVKRICTDLRPSEKDKETPRPTTGTKTLETMKYSVYGMKNGKRTVIRTGLSTIGSCYFVAKNERLFGNKGYDYLIAIPE